MSSPWETWHNYLKLPSCFQNLHKLLSTQVWNSAANVLEKAKSKPWNTCALGGQQVRLLVFTHSLKVTAFFSGVNIGTRFLLADFLWSWRSFARFKVGFEQVDVPTKYRLGLIGASFVTAENNPAFTWKIVQQHTVWWNGINTSDIKCCHLSETGEYWSISNTYHSRWAPVFYHSWWKTTSLLPTVILGSGGNSGLLSKTSNCFQLVTKPIRK